MRLSALLCAGRLRLPPGYRHGTWRPDTAAAQRRNPPGLRRRKVFVEPIAKEDWKVFRGDTVSVPPPQAPPRTGAGLGGPALDPPSSATGPGPRREGRGEAGDGHPGRASP